MGVEPNDRKDTLSSTATIITEHERHGSMKEVDLHLKCLSNAVNRQAGLISDMRKKIEELQFQIYKLDGKIDYIFEQQKIDY